MKRNAEDIYLIDQLKDSDYVYITIWNEEKIYKLYVNDIIAAETTHDVHLLKMEGVRIKKLLIKHNIKVKTNLH